ncbi:MAG: V-type ATP synthase subunit F [Sphaerochaetaceae bacterium]|nr:V-type ATP synthase subunit F [Sphaerochaetaceae bacterium]
MKYYVISDKETVKHFSLIKVDGISVSSKEMALDVFSKAIFNKEIGTILISPFVEEMLGSKVEEQRNKGTFPVVVTMVQ